MFKIIVLLLVIGGAVTSIPALRDRVMPVLAPITSRVSARTEKASQPYYAMKANSQLRDVVHSLTEDRAEGKPLPLKPLEFRTWLKYKGVAPDPWGKQFYLRQKKDSILVGSMGPDTVRGTPDDVITGFK